MCEEMNSLFDLHTCNTNLTSRVIYYDFKSKYTLCYKQFSQTICSIAELLLSLSLSNSIVACLIKPGLLTPSIILGILKVSSAFVFLDIQNPISVLKNIQKYVSVEALLVEDALFKELKELCSCWNRKSCILINKFSFTIIQYSKCVYETCRNSSPQIPKFSNTSPKLAYIMHTSGTTGEPKIVQVPHQCILPNLIDLKSRFDITQHDVILLCSPLTFDPSIIDIFLFMASGCTLVIVPDQMKSIPLKMADVIVDSNITILQGTPSFIKSLGEKFIQNSLLSNESSLKVLAFGGEICPSFKTLQKWSSNGNKTMLFNLYGLTEVSCWATCYKIDLDVNSEMESIPLGEALSNTSIEIDAEGEIHVSSIERWCIINDEICPTNGSQIKRSTGDVAFKSSDGGIYLKGRKDSIIKFKGKKFSLQTVKNVLNGDSEISNCAVVYEHELSKLLLFIVWNMQVNDIVVDEKRCELIAKLRKVCSSLPPIECITVPWIPLTSHGKSDFKKLKQLFISKPNVLSSKSSEKNINLNYMEIILDLWKEYTNHKHVTQSDNFILNGGDSIAALQMSLDIEWKFQILAPDLVETLLNCSFTDVVNLVQSYVYNKSKGEFHKPTFTTLKEEPHFPLFKKLWTDNYSKDSHCYKLFSRQGTLLKCSCFKDHFMSACLKKNESGLSGGHMRMICKFDLKKCIDASPCVAYFFEIDQIFVFIGSHSGMFCNINLLAENIQWKVFLPNRIESSACISSCGNFVFVGCYDHHLYCLDVKKGYIVWKFKTGGEIKCSPIASIKTIFVGSHDKNLYAIEKTGKIVWKQQISKGSIFSSPALSEEHQTVCVATLDGIIALLKMDSGSIVWTYNYGKPIFSSFKLVLTSLYIGTTDEHMLCFDLSGNLLSSYKTNGPVFSSAAYSSLPVACITFGCHDHHVYCLNEKAELLWKFCCDSPVYATPFPFSLGDQYYVAVASTSGTLYILQQSNGQAHLSYQFPGELFSSPVVINDYIIIGCRDDFVYYFKL